MKRPPRSDKRARTRQALIDAAAEVIGERGLDRTSLEEVAARAGMSRGAIYGNFANKEELFLAVAATRWRPVMAPPGPPGESLRDRMHRHGLAVAAAAEERKREAVGATSFVQYALTHEHLRVLIEQANAMVYAAAEERLISGLPAGDRPENPAAFVRAVHALTDGLMMLHALTPSLITHDMIVAAFESLA
jgi:AcrR family transcriptional regulator